MKVANSDAKDAKWLVIENNSGQCQRYIRGEGMEGPRPAHVVGLPTSPSCTRELSEGDFPDEIVGEVEPGLPADSGTSPPPSSKPYYRYKKSNG